MAKGFFLYHLDKTTCGGMILSGASDDTYTIGGVIRQQAREGDPVTCGVTKGTFRICGGMGDTYSVTGAPKQWAGSIESFSSCPCRARFIPLVSTHTYEYDCNVILAADREREARKRALQSGNTGPEQEPKTEQEPEQHAQSVKKKKREITLTIGVFFDGTGNNANNSGDRQAVCTGEHFGLSDADSASALSQCVRMNHGHSGTAAGSYLGYYTNVHWLYTLYNTDLTPDTGMGQYAIYIEGIGTENQAGDNRYGMGTGGGDTGVVKKTDKAIAALSFAIKNYLAKHIEARECTIKEFQFDIFGFSRGAAAARHFANRIYSEQDDIVTAIKLGLNSIEFSGTPGVKTRFLGIFDTVAAIGTPVNGFNPHSADTGDVDIVLRPGVADNVFHITAQHECRFNFALNSVKPAWPELALPGVHSDIGGGYNPIEHEACFLTRPQFETVPLSIPDTQTRVYQQACKQISDMDSYPSIAPLLQAVEINIDTWQDDRMPADRYGMLQKRSGAAAVIERLTRNDWSKVVLRVMIDAAQDAGVEFNAILPKDDHLSLPTELDELCIRAIEMGRAARSARAAFGFSSQEIEMLAGKYIHCSANWNSMVRDSKGTVMGAVKPAKLVTFTNRPDDCWQRTIYDMEGNKIWK